MMFGKYFPNKTNMDETDSNDLKKGNGDAPWLNKKVGNAPRRSRKLDIADEDFDDHENQESYLQRQIRMISNNRSGQVNEKGDTVKGSSTEERNSGLQRKPSYQLMPDDDFDDMILKDSIGFPHENSMKTTRKQPRNVEEVSVELSSMTLEDSIGFHQCREVTQKRSFESHDEAAEEIKQLIKNQTISSSEGQRLLQDLQSRQGNKGFMNRNFKDSQGRNNNSRRRRSFHLSSDEDEAEEIRELVKNETLSATEGRQRLQDLQAQRFPNRGSSKSNQSSKGIPCAFDADGLPQNWSRESPLSHSMFRLIPLCVGNEECDQIYREMEWAGLDVVQVERLQNLDSLEKFKAEMKHMARRRNSDDDLNVRYLYHGTSVDKTCICEEGLDQRLSRMGYFGKGIYFSDNPLKCLNYARSSDTKGESYLLKCRVILGDQKCYGNGEYNTTLKREPEKANPKPGSSKFYDSVMGCPKDYNEYVIYENRRAMIDYIITFKVNQQGQDTLRERIPSPIFDSQGRETGFIGIKAPANEDEHFDRISQVREAIRRKRCEERGQEYSPPNEEKKMKDKEMWLRLQKLHNVDETTLPSLEEKKARLRHAASEPQFQPEDLEGAFTESATNSTMLPHSQSFTCGAGDDDVEKVMTSLIAEFVEVTSCDNSETARYYIEKCKMNIDQAIVCYYDDMP
ncbi:uncharacterized protein LOC133194115 [Saccostrea echinata]|uniref:uncharacterized protein LOC133194115 n=1 Tax=Saccostrea echinata TaxID=191078 RepID=UPI002A81F45B|nr:uncharacterized protein LOC133194115 [Saccostrea echinata]